VQKHWYDANGNMTRRVELSGTQRMTYTQAWDIENRLSVVTNTVTGLVTRFTYDGDGQRVKKTEGATSTVYVGAIYEKNVTTGVTTTYYYAAARVPFSFGAACKQSATSGQRAAP
jgi:YD repeat-containing protein